MYSQILHSLHFTALFCTLKKNYAPFGNTGFVNKKEIFEIKKSKPFNANEKYDR